MLQCITIFSGYLIFFGLDRKQPIIGFFFQACFGLSSIILVSRDIYPVPFIVSKTRRKKISAIPVAQGSLPDRYTRPDHRLELQKKRCSNTITGRIENYINLCYTIYLFTGIQFDLKFDGNLQSLPIVCTLSVSNLSMISRNLQGDRDDRKSWS